MNGYQGAGASLPAGQAGYSAPMERAMSPNSYVTVALVLAGVTYHVARAQEQTTRQKPLVFIVQLEDVSITPVTAQFLDRGIKEAETQ